MRRRLLMRRGFHHLGHERRSGCAWRVAPLEELNSVGLGPDLPLEVELRNRRQRLADPARPVRHRPIEARLVRIISQDIGMRENEMASGLESTREPFSYGGERLQTAE